MAATLFQLKWLQLPPQLLDLGRLSPSPLPLPCLAPIVACDLPPRSICCHSHCLSHLCVLVARELLPHDAPLLLMMMPLLGFDLPETLDADSVLMLLASSRPGTLVLRYVVAVVVSLSSCQMPRIWIKRRVITCVKS